MNKGQKTEADPVLANAYRNKLTLHFTHHMEEPFILELNYKGTALELPAQLQLLGYIQRFVVSLPENDVWFERDEEGAFRAMLPPDVLEKRMHIDVQLIQAIAAKIEAILA